MPPRRQKSDYNGEFWVQIVYLKPIFGLRDQLPYTPVYVDRNFDPVDGSHNGRSEVRVITSNGFGGGESSHNALIDRLTVAGSDDTTDHFRLEQGYLLSNRDIAGLWPDELSSPDETEGDVIALYNGFNLVGFQISTGSDLEYPLLKFRIVKVCTPDNNTELVLRARIDNYDPNNRMSLFSLASLKHQKQIFTNLFLLNAIADLEFYGGLDENQNVEIFTKRPNGTFVFFSPSIRKGKKVLRSNAIH